MDLTQTFQELNEDEDYKLAPKILDIALAIKSQREDFSTLSSDKLKDFLSGVLKETALATSEDVSDQDIQKAVEIYLSKRYDFSPPKPGFNNFIAEKIVNRASITKYYLIPTFAAGVIGLAAYFTTSSFVEYKKGKEERLLENLIAEAFDQKNDLEASFNNSLRDIDDPILEIEKKEIIKAQEKGLNALRSTSAFFDKYTINGDATQGVTPENIQSVQFEFFEQYAKITQVSTHLDYISAIKDEIHSRVKAQADLESLINQARSSPIPKKIMDKIESLYFSANFNFQNAQTDQGTSQSRQILKLFEDYRDFDQLPFQLESVYGSIMEISKEKSMISRANEDYKRAKRFIADIDADNAKLIISDLNSKYSLLQQEYQVRIVNKPGVKSGIDRYFTDSEGTRVSGYYLIVEAVDSNGNILPRDVFNSENGEKEKVYMWGEEVPLEVYERVKNDKLDNGIIDNNIFANKPRGYTKEQTVFVDNQGKILSELGEITKW